MRPMAHGELGALACREPRRTSLLYLALCFCVFYGIKPYGLRGPVYTRIPFEKLKLAVRCVGRLSIFDTGLSKA